MITDTHAHLCSEEFDQDLEAVLARARQEGVDAVIAVGETLAEGEKNLALARRFPAIRPAAGLYPDYADPEQLRHLEDFIRNNREGLVAIGEVGLDFWIARDEETRDLQRTVFRRFIALSRELDLPLNVHSRSAGRQAVELLIDGGARRVQLHAFDGRFSAARPAVEAGYFFSIPPSLVRSRQKEKLVKDLPLTSLLLESDSPVLGPEPGERNEPANISKTIEAICILRKIERRDLLDHVMRNTRLLYGMPA